MSRARSLPSFALAGLLALALLACGQQPEARTSEPTGPRAPAPATEQARSGTKDPYLALAATLQAHRVQVWFEADLVKAWLAGPASFGTAVQRLGDLARGADVSGFKIADEIGYDDGLNSAREARSFLREARAALADAAPGTPLLVDAIVPELGCLPWREKSAQVSCASAARHRYPAASREAMTSYLRAGLVDRLDLSTGLLEPSTYADWGLTRRDAQREAWNHVVSLGWDGMTRLQSRKALAAPGGYRGGRSRATTDLDTFVDAPRAGGARAVDVWTWRQPYSGSTVSLLDEALRPNALWVGLRQRRDGGAVFFTHMTPSAMPTDAAGIARECAVVAQVFSAVFVAAGTG